MHGKLFAPNATCLIWRGGFRNIDVRTSHVRSHHYNVPSSDSQRSTIFALSSPPGKAGVGVVRISGPEALEVRRRMVKRTKLNAAPTEPWKLERCQIVHPESGETLDDGLSVFFKGPKSFTTQDVLELHIHSGRAITSAVLSALSRLDFCRPAEAGEFTRRAFEGGRLDLTQVEGLKDLINADTETQRRVALQSAGGAARAQFETLRNDIIHCLAMVEAVIDFGEDEELDDDVLGKARKEAQQIRQTIQSHLSDNRRGELLRTGIRLAIFGPPNAGKSSLLNFLAQRDAAIVTPVPGTTRDILELSLDIGGLPVVVSDTAGLRRTTDIVESIGVERAKNAVLAADVAICVLSLADTSILTDGSSLKIEIPRNIASLVTPDTLFLLNKVDLSPATLETGAGSSSGTVAIDVTSPNFASTTITSTSAWKTSLSTGAGTQTFLDGFAGLLRERYDLMEDNNGGVNAPLITHERHRTHLSSALQFLDAFLQTDSQDIVLGAEELRYAAQAVGKVSGLIDVEDVLDAVFRDFCIGK